MVTKVLAKNALTKLSMSEIVTKKRGLLLFIVLFFAPLLATLVDLVFFNDTDSSSDFNLKQHWWYQVVFMGFWNIPLLIASGLLLFLANFYDKKLNYRASKIRLALSMFTSIFGSLYFLYWVVG